MARNYVTLSIDSVVHSTVKAFLFRSPDQDEDFWIPKSEIHDDSLDELEEGHHDNGGDILISDWIAAQKGLA